MKRLKNRFCGRVLIRLLILSVALLFFLMKMIGRTRFRSLIRPLPVQTPRVRGRRRRRVSLKLLSNILRLSVGQGVIRTNLARRQCRRIPIGFVTVFIMSGLRVGIIVPIEWRRLLVPCFLCFGCRTEGRLGLWRFRSVRVRWRRFA